jgi:hypothetical protein
MGKKSVYQLPSETLPGLKLSHHVEDLSAVRDFIRSRGTETRNTRIERYLAYLQQAADESTIDAAKILGHASYKTTEQVYTRFTPDFVVGATSALEGLGKINARSTHEAVAPVPEPVRVS